MTTTGASADWRTARAEIFWPIVVLGGWTALVISQGATTEFIHFEF